MGLREIPFGHIMQADLFEQGRTLFAQTRISRVGFNECAQTGHGIIPETLGGTCHDRFMGAGGRGAKHHALAKLTAFNHSAGHDIA